MVTVHARSLVTTFWWSALQDMECAVNWSVGESSASKLNERTEVRTGYRRDAGVGSVPEPGRVAAFDRRQDIAGLRIV